MIVCNRFEFIYFFAKKHIHTYRTYMHACMQTMIVAVDVQAKFLKKQLIK